MHWRFTFCLRYYTHLDDVDVSQEPHSAAAAGDVQFIEDDALCRLFAVGLGQVRGCFGGSVAEFAQTYSLEVVSVLVGNDAAAGVAPYRDNHCRSNWLLAVGGWRLAVGGWLLKE